MNIKKIISLFVVTSFTILLIACGESTNKAQAVVEEVLEGIEYHANDKRTSVTGDLYFPTESEIHPSANIEWVSDNLDIISDSGQVTRPESNLRVKVEVFVEVDGDEASGSISFTVMKVVEDDEEEVPTDGKISTAAEFMAITDFSKDYELTNDIDFNGAEIEPLGYIGSVTWEGVVDPNGVFSGTFDGKGFALMNFKLTGSAHPDAFAETNIEGTTSYMFVSIFPNLTGTVKNLAIVNATITGDGFSGGVAGLMETNALIENVFFSGSVTSAKSWGSTENWAVPGGSIVGMIGGIAAVRDVLVIPTSLMGNNLVTGFNYSTRTSGIFVVNDNVLDVIEFATPEKGDETQYLRSVGATTGDIDSIPQSFSHWAKYYSQ